MVKKILLIEKDSKLQKDISKSLTNEGYSVINNNGDDKLAILINKQQPDLIICNDNLPLANMLLQIQTTMEENFQNIPIIVIGTENKNNILEAYSLNCYDYIVKPIDNQILLAKINAASNSFNSFDRYFSPINYVSNNYVINNKVNKLFNIMRFLTDNYAIIKSSKKKLLQLNVSLAHEVKILAKKIAIAKQVKDIEKYELYNINSLFRKNTNTRKMKLKICKNDYQIHLNNSITSAFINWLLYIFANTVLAENIIIETYKNSGQKNIFSINFIIKTEYKESIYNELKILNEIAEFIPMRVEKKINKTLSQISLIFNC
jgi:DNA-binding response OmpR family regulator